jgi:hypothetical protein
MVSIRSSLFPWLRVAKIPYYIRAQKPISREVAIANDLTIESLPEYAERNHLSLSGARKRCYSGRLYSFVVANQRFCVTKDGKDVSWIAFP